MFAVTSPTGVHAQAPGARDTTRVDTLAATTAAEAGDRPANEATSSRHGVSITSWPDEDAAPAHRLPFADNPIPTEYPSVAMAFGYADFRSEFRGVQNAFHAIEDSIRAGGYPVPASTGVQSVGMFLFALDVSLNPFLDGSLQLGKTSDKNSEMWLVGGLVSGRYTLPQADDISLLAGLGAGAYRLHLERHYGVPLTDVYAGGGYTRLDYIRLEGGGAYGTVVGRIALRVDPHTAFEGAVQYFGMSDVSTDAGGAGRLSVNASGTTFGLYFRVIF